MSWLERFKFTRDGALMKKILVIYYSQTGQTEAAVKSILSQQDSKINIDYYFLKPEHDYSFPWEVDKFLNVMPESVLQKPIPIIPIPINSSEKYDLIILAYQPWFLSISLPMLSFLHSNQGKEFLKNKPVLTVITCRNMWVNAQDRMKEYLDSISATLIGNIVLCDKHSNTVSFITVIRWLIHGRKKAGLLFPDAGVLNKDIDEASRFGPIITKYLEENNLESLDKALLEAGSIYERPELALYERNVYKRFKILANIIIHSEPSATLSRKVKLRIFMYLIFLTSFITFPLVGLIEAGMNIKRHFTK